MSDARPRNHGSRDDSAELVVETLIVPLRDDPDGRLRDRQLAAIVRLLRRAAHENTQGACEEKALEIHGDPCSHQPCPQQRRAKVQQERPGGACDAPGPATKE